jgi:hypothetical protein
MGKILYLIVPLSILIVLFLCFQTNTRQTQAISNPFISNQQTDPEKEKFEPARKMLLESGVQFDPDILLSADWRERLDPSFINSYEMQTTLRTGNELKGVQIADTLVLPEKVELTGDLVIIANTLIYEGNNPVIEGVGKNVYIFPINEAFPIGKTFESALREQGIVRESIPEKGQRANEKYLFKDKADDGVITIKVKGQGPAEWSKTAKERFKGSSYRQNSVIPEAVCPPICQGDQGAPGGIGDPGTFSGNYPPEPDNGRPSICSSRKPELANGGDGKISQQDAIFSRLRLWQDTNHNGVSESCELFTLPELGLRKIDLDYRSALTSTATSSNTAQRSGTRRTLN